MPPGQQPWTTPQGRRITRHDPFRGRRSSSDFRLPSVISRPSRCTAGSNSRNRIHASRSAGVAAPQKPCTCRKCPRHGSEHSPVSRVRVARGFQTLAGGESCTWASDSLAVHSFGAPPFSMNFAVQITPYRRINPKIIAHKITNNTNPTQSQKSDPLSSRRCGPHNFGVSSLVFCGVLPESGVFSMVSIGDWRIWEIE